MVNQYMIERPEFIGKGKLWMVLLQRHLLALSEVWSYMVKEYLGITVDAANRHDMKMTKATLQSIVVHRPEPTTRAKQHMCMDKGYDFPEVADYGYTIHIKLRLRGE